MWTRQHRKRKHGRLVMPVLTALFVAYFGFHVVHGSFGLRAKDTFEVEKARLELALKTEREQREALERRIALLRDGSIERDMLDEKARSYLNMSRTDEIVIFH